MLHDGVMRSVFVTLSLAGSLLAADTIYEFGLKTIDGKDLALSEYKGKAVLVVNTASQ